MKKWMNRIGLALLAAAAFAMVAGDLLAGEPSRDTQGTPQKFYLTFDIFSPADITCDATGPGVRTRFQRNLAGRPILRVTGNAEAAQITCARPDGSRFTTTANRSEFYNTAEPLHATVLFREGLDAMQVLLTRGDRDIGTPQRNFVRVQ
ncbi:hypothetical protein SAMN06265221_10199 [Paracoccus laeviglucosivorans]|uniref:Uncharacterized protein n=2 Tax=Paracoccus laeviglucosivorans TaxID=1197861 RepID=A0A521AFF4_9RHOB|nr:hypothetical protein SAMN06265221_10199 [Paracoccus laeviglucosivorans]